MKLRIYAPARADLEHAYAFIADDSPRAAQAILERILAALEGLTANPHIGRPGRVAGTRELVIARTPYLAIYEVTDQGPAVVRVLHGRQAWPPSTT